MSLTDRERRQVESTHSLFLPPEVDKALVDYAAANAMSVSEASREIMAAYLGDEPIPPTRKRQPKRRTIWVAGELWLRYRAKARKDKITNARIFQRALLGEDEDA